MAPPVVPDPDSNLAGIAYRIALKLLEDREDASEVAQDTMVAYRVAGGCIERPEGWVSATARNRALNLLRKRRHGERAVQRLASEVSSHPDHDDVALERIVIEALFEGLSPKEHEVAHLRFVDELSREQIALRLDMSVNTVKTHLQRAVKKIRRSLDESREEEGL